VAALNKQGNLNEYFDVSTGNGTYAPRKRQAYSSKRLQQVVSEFRSERAKHNKGHSPSPAISDGNVASGAENGVDEEPAKKRRKTRTKGTGQAEAAEPRDSTRKATGRRGRGTSAGKRKIAKAAVDNDEDEYLGNSGDAEGFAPQLRPRPKPVYEDNVVDAGDRE
jgi:DNA excision repair protein ERCC-5